MSKHWHTRFLPHPVLSIILALSWMALTQSMAVGTILFALLLALIIPRLIHGFVITTPPIRWHLAFKLFLVVLYDIVVSNFIVAKMVLGSMQRLQPKWIRVPLTSEHEHVNSLLAMIITITPGTVSAGIDLERGDILVHCLNTQQPEQDISDIKTRYEQPLLAIFNVTLFDESTHKPKGNAA